MTINAASSLRAMARELRRDGSAKRRRTAAAMWDRHSGGPRYPEEDERDETSFDSPGNGWSAADGNGLFASRGATGRRHAADRAFHQPRQRVDARRIDSGSQP